MKRILYNTDKYNFKEIVSSWFDNLDLHELHKKSKYHHFKRKDDQSTKWHAKFYSRFISDNSFRDIYISFLRDVVCPLYNESIVYQKIPTFRVHFPNNVGVGEFHKDKHYRDEVWAEKVQELNYFLPLTKAKDTSTVWAESIEDKKDFKPINSNYGELIEWDASNLMHGNKDNLTGETRVSFDFRVIKKSKYIESNKGSINTNTPFTIGNYYEELK